MRSGAGLSEDTKRRYTREAEFTRAEDHATLPRNRRGFRKRLQYPCGLVNKKEGRKRRTSTHHLFAAARGLNCGIPGHPGAGLVPPGGYML